MLWSLQQALQAWTAPMAPTVLTAASAQNRRGQFDWEIEDPDVLCQRRRDIASTGRSKSAAGMCKQEGPLEGAFLLAARYS